MRSAAQDDLQGIRKARNSDAGREGGDSRGIHTSPRNGLRLLPGLLFRAPGDRAKPADRRVQTPLSEYSSGNSQTRSRSKAGREIDSAGGFAGPQAPALYEFGRPWPTWRGRVDRR